MQTKIKTKLAALENPSRMEAQTKAARRPRAEGGERASAMEPSRNAAVLHNAWLAIAGVPFSPLND